MVQVQTVIITGKQGAGKTTAASQLRKNNWIEKRNWKVTDYGSTNK